MTREIVAFLHRWVYNDFYIPLWPNIVATLVCGVPAFIHLHAKINRHHKEHLDAIRNSQSGREL